MAKQNEGRSDSHHRGRGGANQKAGPCPSHADADFISIAATPEQVNDGSDLKYLFVYRKIGPTLPPYLVVPYSVTEDDIGVRLPFGPELEVDALSEELRAAVLLMVEGIFRVHDEENRHSTVDWEEESSFVATRLPRARDRISTVLPIALKHLVLELVLDATIYSEEQKFSGSQVQKVIRLANMQLKKRLAARSRGGSPKFYKDMTDEQRMSFSLAYDSATKVISVAERRRDEDEEPQDASDYLLKKGAEEWMIREFENTKKFKAHRLAHYLAAKLAGLPIRHHSGEKRKGSLISLRTLTTQRQRGDTLRGVRRKELGSKKRKQFAIRK